MAERGYTAIADMVIDTIQQCAGMDLGISGGGDSSGGGGGGSSSQHHSGTRHGSSSSHGAERGTWRSTALAAGSGRSGGADGKKSNFPSTSKICFINKCTTFNVKYVFYLVKMYTTWLEGNLAGFSELKGPG